MEIIFLSLEEVKWIHNKQIKISGGAEGIRDNGLLESAVFSPQQGYYSDLFEIASAYLFNITQNHSFIDGNKRTGVFSAIFFLEKNGIDFIAHPDELLKIALSVAKGEIKDKKIIIDFLKKNSRISPFIF